MLRWCSLPAACRRLHCCLNLVVCRHVVMRCVCCALSPASHCSYCSPFAAVAAYNRRCAALCALQWDSAERTAFSHARARAAGMMRCLLVLRRTRRRRRRSPSFCAAHRLRVHGTAGGCTCLRWQSRLGLSVGVSSVQPTPSAVVMAVIVPVCPKEPSAARRRLAHRLAHAWHCHRLPLH